MSLILLLSGLCAAHPMASNLYGHRLELRLQRGELRALYVAEVPTAVVLRDLRERADGKPDRDDTDAYVAEQEAELLGGLRLSIDGQSAAWRPSDEAAPNGEGDARFVSFGLALRAPLPEAARTIQIVDGNLPDEPSLFLVALEVHDDLVIDDTSLLDLDEHGAARRDRSGQWRAEEQSRDLRIAFRPRGPASLALLRAGARLSGRGEAASWAGPAERLARAPWGGLEPPERWALGLPALSLGVGLSLGWILGAPRRGALSWVAAGALALVGLAWPVALLVARLGALTVSTAVALGGAAALAGAVRARRPGGSPRTALLFALCGLLVALGAGALLFIWGSVQSVSVGEIGPS